MLVPHQGAVDSRAGSMINAKITHLWISSKEVAFLLVYHEFLNGENRETLSRYRESNVQYKSRQPSYLDEFPILCHVKVKSSCRFTGPATKNALISLIKGYYFNLNLTSLVCHSDSPFFCFSLYC